MFMGTKVLFVKAFQKSSLCLIRFLHVSSNLIICHKVPLKIMSSIYSFSFGSRKMKYQTYIFPSLSFPCLSCAGFRGGI